MKNEVDLYVGRRIRHRRWLLGMTQVELADQVGVKFQQIQKYETGKNRVSSSKLWMIANAQTVPVAYYFEGLEIGQDSDVSPKIVDLAKFFQDREALQLVAMYRRLPPRSRSSLASLAKAISNGE